MPSAVVLLSGGLDSYTAAAILQRDGFDVCALSVMYGQRHAREIDVGPGGCARTGRAAAPGSARGPGSHWRLGPDG